MREWLTLQELAGLRLAKSAPQTRQGWLEIAMRDGWRARRDQNGEPLCRLRHGFGSVAVEYYISLLPLSAQVGYAVVTMQDDGEAPAADARRFLVEAAKRVQQITGWSWNVSRRAFAACYSLSIIPAPDWVRAEHPKVAASTISMWKAQFIREDYDAGERLERAWNAASPKVQAEFLAKKSAVARERIGEAA